MNKNHIKPAFIFTLLYLLLVSSAIAADTTTVISKLRNMVEAAQYKTAYQFAQDNVEIFAGKPKFDYWMGIAAYDAGYPDEALFVFERVLLVDPGHAKARAYRDKIKKGQAVHSYISDHYWYLGGGHDTNVNEGPHETTVNLAPFAAGIGQDTKVQADEYFRARLLGNWFYLFNDETALFLHGRAEHRENITKNKFDRTTFYLRGGPEFVKSNHHFRFPVTLEAFYFNDRPYRYYLSLSGEYIHNVAPVFDATYFVEGGAILYRHSGHRDVSFVTLGTHWHYQPDYTPVNFKAKVYFGLNEAWTSRGSYNDNVYYGFTSVAYRPVCDKHTLFVRFNYQRRDHDEANPLYGKSRHENIFTAGAGWDWRVTSEWLINADYKYKRYESDIDLYEHDQHMVELGVRRKI